MAGAEIRVEGLKEFRRELKAVDASFPKELRRINKRIADQVADRTRGAMASRPGVAPKVVPSVKALAQQTGAAVKFGGERYPYAMGAEFGSHRYKQFPPVKKGGYTLYPAIAEMRDEISTEYLRAISEIAARAFPI